LQNSIPNFKEIENWENEAVRFEFQSAYYILCKIQSVFVGPPGPPSNTLFLSG
jgi:hypothetical protein